MFRNSLKNLHRRITLTILTQTILGLMMAEIMMHGMMFVARLDGMKVGNEPTTIPQAHFHYEVLLLVQ